MRARSVGIKAASVARRIVRKILIFGDQVHHVQTQAIHAAIGPEFADLFQLGAHGGVFPVQVGLFRREKV
ncbi:Uncharacterised protein [Salmonella enterica subsp. enterica serovar Bovismorbificans]|nr:Uncharacterised protein [Salmonella enterica subsp. enterica serovar Bovismorbificans]